MNELTTRFLLGNNTYKEENSYAERYRVNATDAMEKINFYNKIAGDFEGITPEQSMDVYSMMVQQNSLVPDYSPLSEYYNLDKIYKAGKYAGMDSVDIMDKYKLGKQMLISKSMSEATSFNGLLDDVTGSGFVNTLNKIDKSWFNNSINNENIAGISDVFNSMDPTQYKGFEEYLQSDNSLYAKSMGISLYKNWLEGEKNEDFNPATQLVTSLKENVYIDKDNKKVHVYNYAPIYNSFSALTDETFWKNVVDEEKTFGGKLLTSLGNFSTGTLQTFGFGKGMVNNLTTAGRTNAYAQMFIDSPLVLYLNQSGKENIHRSELEAAIENTFDLGDTKLNLRSAQSVSDTVSKIMEGALDGTHGEETSPISTLKNTELGILMNKIKSDKYVQSSAVSNDNSLMKDIFGYNANTTNYVFSQLSNFSTAALSGITDFTDGVLTANKYKSKALADAEEFENIDDYLRQQDTNLADSTALYKAINDSYTTVDRATDEELAEMWSDIDSNGLGTSIFARFANLQTLGFANKGAKNKIFSTNMIEQVRGKLTDQQNSRITDEQITEMYKSNVVNDGEQYLKAQEIVIDKFIEDDDDKRLMINNIKNKSKTYAEFREVYDSAKSSKTKAYKEIFVPYVGNYGRTKVGKKGFGKAYEQNVDITGFAEDLFAEFIFDPTTYIGISELKTAGKTAKSVARAGKTTLKNVGENSIKQIGTEFTDKFFRSYNDDVVEEIVKNASSSLADRFSDIKIMQQSGNLNARAQQLATEVSSITSGISSQITPEVLGRELDTKSIRTFNNLIGEDIQKLDELLAETKINSTSVERMFADYSKASRNKRSQIINGIKDIDNKRGINLNKRLQEITESINYNVHNLYNALEDGSPVKLILEQYAKTTDNIINDTLEQFQKKTLKSQSRDKLSKELERDIRSLIDDSNVYRGLNSRKALMNFKDQIGTFSDSVVDYIVDDTMDINAAYLNTTNKVNPKFKKSQKVGDDIDITQNIIGDFYETLHNKYLNDNRSVSRKIKLKRSTPDEGLAESLYNSVDSLTSVEEDIFSIGEDIIGEIINDQGFKSKVNKLMKSHITKLYDLDGDSMEMFNSSFQDNFKQLFTKHIYDKYKKKALRGVETMTEQESVLAYFADKDVMYDYLKPELRKIIGEQIPSYDDFIRNRSSELIKAAKEDLGLSPKVRKETFIKRYNEAHGLGEITYDTISRWYQQEGLDFSKNLLSRDAIRNEILEKTTLGDLKKYSGLVDNSTNKERFFKKHTKSKIYKSIPNDVKTNVIKRSLMVSDETKLAKLIPNEYKKVKELIEANIDRTKPFEDLESIIFDFAEGTRYNADSYYKNLGFTDVGDTEITDLKSLYRFATDNTVLANILDGAKGGNVVDNLSNDKITQLANMFAQHDPKFDPSLYDEKFLGKDLLRNSFSTFGNGKLRAIEEVKNTLRRQDEKNIFHNFDFTPEEEDLHTVLNNHMKDYRTYSTGVVKNDKKTLANTIKKKVGITAEMGEVMDAVKSEYGSVNTNIRQHARRVGEIRTQLNKMGVADSLDKTLLAKRFANSFDETTTSYHELLNRHFLSEGNDKELLTFDLTDDNMNKVLSSLNNMEFLGLPSLEDEVLDLVPVKLSDMFDINVKTIPTEDGTSKFLNVSKKSNMDKQALETYKSNFGRVIKGIKSSPPGSPEWVDALQPLNDKFQKELNEALPDIFSSKTHIRLIDNETLKVKNARYDKEINTARNATKKNGILDNLVDDYIRETNDYLASASSGLYTVAKKLDPTLQSFYKTDAGRYYKTMMQRRGISPDDVSEVDKFMFGDNSTSFYEEARNTLTRTYFKPNEIKRINKASRTLMDRVLGTEDLINGSSGAIKHASLKGSYEAKSALSKDLYGTGDEPFITNILRYGESVQKANIDEMLKSMFASNIDRQIKQGSKKVSRVKASEVKIPLQELKTNLFNRTPELYADFADRLSKVKSVDLSLTDLKNGQGDIVMDRKFYNFLKNQNVMLNKVQNPYLAMRALKTGLKYIQRIPSTMALIGSFPIKIAMSAVPLMASLPYMKNGDVVRSLISTSAIDKSFNKALVKSPQLRSVVNDLTKKGISDIDDILKHGEANLDKKTNDLFRKYYVLDHTRNSSLLKNMNYGRYKSYQNNFRDSVSFNRGAVNAKTYTTEMLSRAKNGLMPNFHPIEQTVLARAQLLAEDSTTLNKLLKNYYGESLAPDSKMSERIKHAMRVAEGEMGITDGMLNNKDSLAQSIFFFWNQLTTGLPNILATYFGTWEGVMSTLKFTKDVAAFNRASTQSQMNEINSDVEYDPQSIMFGYNVSDQEKILALNTYTPYDIIDQFTDTTPLNVLFDSINPVVKYPLELLAGDDLSNYNSSGSNVDMFAESVSAKDKWKYGTLGLLEASTGSVYRYADQMRKLITGRTRFGEAGEDIVYLPGSTDAELELLSDGLRDISGIRGTDIKNGYIDSLPVLSSLLDVHNKSDSVTTANTITMLKNITYNDKYMASLENTEYGGAVRNNIYNAIKRRMLFDMFVSGDDLDDELLAITSQKTSVNTANLLQKIMETKQKNKQSNKEKYIEQITKKDY